MRMVCVTTAGKGRTVRRGKYNNRITIRDGIKFHSVKEARRYGELRLLERSGKIFNLTLQRPFPININGVPVCVYRADFTYTERPSGRYVVEDVKGVRTVVYKLKKKLVLACYAIAITET